MKSIRVLLLHPFDAYSGSQRVAATLAKALDDSGMDLKVHLGFGTKGFVSQWPGLSRFLGVDNIPARKLLYPLWLLAMVPRMLLAVLRGDVVWANTVNSVAAVLPMILLAPRRVVIHAHEIEFAGLTKRLLGWAGHRGAKILCVSHLHAQRLGISADVLPNCVEAASDAPPQRVPKVIFVGMVSGLKGFPLFLEVAKRLPRERVRMVAYVPFLPLGADDLLKDVEDAGIEVNVGRVDPLDIYPGATLLLQCTDPALWTETFSLVMVEALACSVPVATAGMAVAAEVLGDAWAFDVPDRDADRIAAEVERLLAAPERLVALREAARVRRERYTYERFRAQVATIVTQAHASPS